MQSILAACTLKRYEYLTLSDTERLAIALEEFGANALHNIDGMFSFAFYDQLQTKLLLARDRFGQKPLYYVSSNGLFAFSSELLPLLNLSSFIDFRFSTDALSQYLALRYVHPPISAIEPIRKLRPGIT